jgi:threonine dehydrogenase-like Zn-dependent dehydrogenase
VEIDMRGLYLKDGELQFLSDYSKPEPEAGFSLVRVTTAGICSTDLELVKGYHGFQGILGHEFVGIVEQSDDDAMVGQRVVGGINIGCGSCSICLGRGPEHCLERTVLGIINHDGAFADYLLLPDENLVTVPDVVGDETAIFTEPLAAALRILEQTMIRPSADIAVVGPGRLGMLIGQVLRLSGSQVTMLGRRAESLSLARELRFQCGFVDEAIDARFDVVVEATGNEAGLAHSLRIIRPQALLILKSTFAGMANVDLSKIVVSEITVIGSRCGPFEPALRLLTSGKIETLGMIDGRYSLSNGIAAFAHAAQPGIRKILLQISS